MENALPCYAPLWVAVLIRAGSRGLNPPASLFAPESYLLIVPPYFVAVRITVTSTISAAPLTNDKMVVRPLPITIPAVSEREFTKSLKLAINKIALVTGAIGKG